MYFDIESILKFYEVLSEIFKKLQKLASVSVSLYTRMHFDSDVILKFYEVLSEIFKILPKITSI